METNIYLNIHSDIIQKLNLFIEKRFVPNILLYGPSGSGKKYLINNFLLKVYNHQNDVIKNNIMYVNCIHGKGINFIRDELKLFAKTNVNGLYFKSIILVMIDKLTLDAQSALRRCIELYNHNTRFFAIVENKSSLIRPLLSRFCDMKINYPELNGTKINLHEYFKINNISVQQNKQKATEIVNNVFQKYLKIHPSTNNHSSHPSYNISSCIDDVKYMYENGITSLDCIWYIENNLNNTHLSKYHQVLLVVHFHKIRLVIRNEMLMIFLILYLGIIRRTSIPDFINKL